MLSTILSSQNKCKAAAATCQKNRSCVTTQCCYLLEVENACSDLWTCNATVCNNGAYSMYRLACMRMVLIIMNTPFLGPSQVWSTGIYFKEKYIKKILPCPLICKILGFPAANFITCLKMK